MKILYVLVAQFNLAGSSPGYTIDHYETADECFWAKEALTLYSSGEDFWGPRYPFQEYGKITCIPVRIPEPPKKEVSE